MPYFGTPRPNLAASGPIGNGTPNSGAFTTLSASGAVSGAGITSLFSAPLAIGSVTPNSGAFTTLSASGAITGTGVTALFASPPAIGATAPGTGKFTAVNATSVGATTPGTGAFSTLSASGAITGAGVTALFASPPAIGGTAPAAGAFTTLGATGKITPSTTSGIAGTTLADNAVAGSVGEFISSTVLIGSAISLTAAIAANITSVSLTPGDWDVDGIVNFTSGASTLATNLFAWTSATSATLPTVLPNNGGFANLVPSPIAGNAGITLVIGAQRFNVSTTTTVYLSTDAGFTVSTFGAYGIIRARRVR